MICSLVAVIFRLFSLPSEHVGFGGRAEVIVRTFADRLLPDLLPNARALDGMEWDRRTYENSENPGNPPLPVINQDKAVCRAYFKEY